MTKVYSLVLGLSFFASVINIEIAKVEAKNEKHGISVRLKSYGECASRQHMTSREKVLDDYAADFLKKRKAEENEIISMLKTIYSDFLNGEYDRSSNTYKEENSRTKHIDIFLGQLDSEIFDIKELIQKEQHNDKSQQEIFTLLKIVFIAKHLIGKACYDEFRKEDNNKLVITEKEFLEKYAQEFFKVKNLFQYVDQLQKLFTDVHKKDITNELVAVANDFFKKMKESTDQ